MKTIEVYLVWEGISGVRGKLIEVCGSYSRASLVCGTGLGRWIETFRNVEVY
jgi:hypothetical protein